jgi:dipeptidyl aminopeptidase/acylaminoacyl peptidase
MASLSVLAGARATATVAKEDGATWLQIDDAEFKRHQGLLMKHPDLGAKRVVFSYCEFWNEQYTIFSTDSGRWTPLARRNYYYPDLAPDDSSLLVQTMVNGRDEIWLSRGQGREPRFLVAGAYPSWREGGKSFVYVSGNSISLATIDSGQLTNNILIQAGSGDREFYDLVCSPQGNFLAYCVEDKSEAEQAFQLRRYDFAGNREEIVLAGRSRLEQPAWSPDERALLFVETMKGNREVWARDLLTRESHQLTHHRGEDTSPVWDAANNRILFTSDRGRGLEFSAIFWLPAPTIPQ